MATVVHNLSGRSRSAWRPVPRRPIAFHRSLPGYEVTPLHESELLARACGVRELWVKDETRRLGLPSFKSLGASWAAFNALRRRYPEARLESLADCREHVARVSGLRFVAASDGNHGRAVARVARWLGVEAAIWLPAGTDPARLAAIVAEGASATMIEGTYDDAVALVAAQAAEDTLVIADTTFGAAEETAGWVIDGYSTLFAEIDAQLEARGRERPGVLVVQMGVGSLAAAAIRHHRRRAGETRPFILGVEPVKAACVAASLAAGRIAPIPGPYDSAMAGLNAGQPSRAAWDDLVGGLDAIVTVEEEVVAEAIGALEAAGVPAGESGAAGVAALMSLRRSPAALRESLALHREASVLVLATEGRTSTSTPGVRSHTGTASGAGSSIHVTQEA
jgi:diaminopropionate ammonia-lyase